MSDQQYEQLLEAKRHLNEALQLLRKKRREKGGLGGVETLLKLSLLDINELLDNEDILRLQKG